MLRFTLPGAMVPACHDWELAPQEDCKLLSLDPRTPATYFDHAFFFLMHFPVTQLFAAFCYKLPTEVIVVRFICTAT